MKKKCVYRRTDLLKKVKNHAVRLLCLSLIAFVAVNPVFGQGSSQSISGKVVDSFNDPIPGVNVLVKGTLRGTITDMDGNYVLQASPNETIVYRFIGFNEKEVLVGDQTTINITLTGDIIDMDEVVVIGYGVQQKSLVTGAISSIDAKEMENMSVGRVEEAMQGRTAGVFILPESGSPGAGMKVRIRGAGSNSNSNPLFIVDGVRMSDINSISPDDIASVEVLKDAASSAIYGAEGGNGVIIISTKSGDTKAGVVTYNLKYGIQSPGDMPRLMNGKEYGQFQNEAGYLKAENLPVPTDQIGTDWLGEMFSNAPIMNHNLSFAGGSEKTNYFSSISYFAQEGITGGDKSKFDRLSVRLNVDHNIKSWLKVSTRMTYARTKRSALTEDDEFGGVIGTGLLIDPLTPVSYEQGKEPQHVKDIIAGENGDNVVRNADGNVYGISKYIQGEMVNPFIQMEIANGQSVTDKVIGSIALEITPFKGLTITSRPGIDYSYDNFHNWTPRYAYSVERNNNKLAVNDNWGKYYQWQWENFAAYNHKFNSGNINVVLGMSAQESSWRYLNSSSAEMSGAGDKFAEHDFTGRDEDNVSGNENSDRLVSYFGRASYDYKNRYMLQATLRRDLTSTVNVPKDGIAGTFPSFSVGWNLSEEEFFPESVINWVKMRGSWGQNGSIQAIKSIGQFRYTSTIVTEGLRYPTSDGGFITVAEPGVLPNPDLTWETSEQTNLGIDIRGWDSKISFTFDYFVKKTKDLLLEGQFPSTAGNNFPIVNAGDVKNSGVELGLGYQNRKGDFKYGANVNITTLKNEVTGLNSPTARINGTSIGTGSWVGATAFEVGEPIWYFRGHKTNGIDKVTGEPIFVDTDGKPGITDDDRVNLGDPHPDIMYGASMFAEYKGFDLNVLIQGQAGNQIVYGWMRTDRLTSNRLYSFYENRWTPTNTNASMPKASADIKTYASDLMVQDGDFMRIKQIQLGYSIPKSVLQYVYLSNVRVFVSLDDYFTFTKYKGMDPVAGSSNDNSLGIDRGVYPTPRKLMFGLSVSF